MEYLQVRNWRTFQHYTMRNPPWIRVYNSLLEDPAFAGLPDTAKAHLVGIWLYASRSENRIPDDAKFIGGRINATDTVDLNLLVSSGFLEPHCNASNMLASCKQDASNVLAQNRIEENRKEQNRAEKNSACSVSKNLPPITKQEERLNAERVRRSWGILNFVGDTGS
jgi:hypothetical protein